METLHLPLTIKVFKESTSKQVPYVAYSPELELSAAGKDAASAKKALLRVVNDVLGHKIKEGSLAAFLDELQISHPKSGFKLQQFVWEFPVV